MNPGKVIEEHAASAYRSGVDPIRFTAAVLEIFVEETFGLDCCQDPRARVLAWQIMGAAINCGWTPPGRPE